LLAVSTQLFLWLTKRETGEEIRVILLFHILATAMELFKTNPAIGSWSYPEHRTAIFAIATVPLFTGFLYSAVGSYISRAWKELRLRYTNYPKTIYVALLAAAIYINFFTHHFFYDIRYILFAVCAVLFWRTTVSFTAYKKERSMPFLLSAFLSAFFIWIAENIGSFSNVWLYPDQITEWHMVSLSKMGSWFLLLIVSFVLVGLVHFRDANKAR
jgi:uncharacterized membrane protein YoaT (DUF817 family)